jgi:NTE family protein
MGKKIALVLSGGGARGLAHIGVIEELEKREMEISSIAGTSMGALVGGVYAYGKLEEFKNWMYTLDKRKVFSLVDFTLSTSGLVKGDRVLKAMKEFIPDKNIEELGIDFSATAADITNHKELVYRSGSLYKAIRASIAIPTVITPVLEEGKVIVDGGVMNNLPVKNVTRNEGDMLIAVYVNANVPVSKPKDSRMENKAKQSGYRKKISEFYEYLHELVPESKTEKMGFFNLIENTITSMTYQQVQLTLENHPPDMLVEVSRDICGTYDFYKAEEVVEAGRREARKVLENLD